MFDRKIRIFMAVVEEGSFLAAGKKLYMSQSAVSQQLARLEKELGISLFNRES
ncbi:LysR family transcriptional regulator, partial [Sharpea azabuensis]|uniref:LysR family transcriptional regulator n=1 Tax=Sharpea azabuensis TaxID=322505 RepID=UPI003C705A6B